VATEKLSYMVGDAFYRGAGFMLTCMSGTGCFDLHINSRHMQDSRTSSET